MKAQTDNDTLFSNTDTIPFVDEYEVFNKILGGDSIRYCDGYKCIGWIKDFYPDNTLKHRGFYVDGQLESVYKNYYNNGQLEREFTLKNYKNSTMNKYYPDGKILSEIKYLFTDPVSWIDYYPNGNVEYVEKYNNSGTYILERLFYYESGQLQSELRLLNKRNNIFEKNEYYPDGILKLNGNMLYNVSLNDYQKNGIWKNYGPDGKIISEEHFYKNKLIDPSETNYKEEDEEDSD